MSAIPPGPASRTETFLTLRGLHETNETDAPAKDRLGAHARVLRRPYLRDAEHLIPRPGGSGGVHGDAGVPVQHNGLSQDALGLLPRLQSALHRHPAAARGTAVATGRNREDRSGARAA